MFDATTLVRDEIGEDYTLKVISDVNDDNMTIVRTRHLVISFIQLRITREFAGIKPVHVLYVNVCVTLRPPHVCQRLSILLLCFFLPDLSSARPQSSPHQKYIRRWVKHEKLTQTFRQPIPFLIFTGWKSAKFSLNFWPQLPSSQPRFETENVFEI